MLSPGGLGRVLGCEIDLYARCCHGWRTRVDSGIWNLHCAVPNASSTVDSCRNLEAGIPGPTFLVMRFMEINIQVCPFSLWRNLKLFVPLDILEIGTDEDFGHVPIPQSVRLG